MKFCTSAGMALFVLLSYPMQSAIALSLNALPWRYTWDFRARQLSPSDGLSSSAGFVIEPPDTVVFFGWLGAIGAGSGFGAPLVGFAKIAAPLAQPPGPTFPVSIEIEARSDAPGIVYELCLTDEGLDRETAGQRAESEYAASFTPTGQWTRTRWVAADFELLSRGRKLSGYPPVDFNRLTSIAFQVRKSGQSGGNASSQTRLPFRLEVRTLELKK